MTSTPTPDPIRALSETCKESYEFLQEHCPIWANVYHHALSDRSGLRCNLDQTTLYLHVVSKTNNKDFTTQLPQQALLARSLILEYVRENVDDISPVLHILKTFRNLEYLVIIASHDWSFLGVELAFDNTFEYSKVEEQLSRIDGAAFEDIRKDCPGWRMPLMKCLESGGNHDRIDTMYHDIFPQPSDPKWMPFRRMDLERKWHNAEKI